MLQHSDLDRAFHALADPGRRSMVERLTRGPASVSELAAPLHMTLTAVGQHVKVLEASGLVTSHKRGRIRYCRLEVETLQGVEAWIRDRRRGWEQRLDRLRVVLLEDEPAPAGSEAPDRDDHSRDHHNRDHHSREHPNRDHHDEESQP